MAKLAASPFQSYADFNGSGTLLTRYVSGLAVDELFARTSSGGTTAWYLTDRLGWVRDVVNSSGTVIDHIVYDSYGDIMSETSTSNGDRFKFAGMEYDSTTRIYYDHARYYDPNTGRFVSQDPKGFAAGDANLYRYVENGPTSSTDPCGLQISGPGDLPDDVFAPPESPPPLQFPPLPSKNLPSAVPPVDTGVILTGGPHEHHRPDVVVGIGTPVEGNQPQETYPGGPTGEPAPPSSPPPRPRPARPPQRFPILRRILRRIFGS